jgi:hypothetical protein
MVSFLLKKIGWEPQITQISQIYFLVYYPSKNVYSIVIVMLIDRENKAGKGCFLESPAVVKNSIREL